MIENRTDRCIELILHENKNWNYNSDAVLYQRKQKKIQRITIIMINYDEKQAS